MPDLHVIVISSVRPEPTSAGQIVLHRHLVNQPGITLEVYGSEPSHPKFSKRIRQIGGYLGKTCIHRLIEDFWGIWGGRWIDAELPYSINQNRRTIVLTVAHGDGFMAARRFARHHKLPLISIFHDWWPDMVAVHWPVKRLIERNFMNLARESTVTFCVCEGMRKALGSLPNAKILPPIPSATSEKVVKQRDPGQPFKVVCSGNMSEYGSMLGDALEESLNHPEILFQVRGANPSWSDERKSKMRQNGRWLDFAPRSELETWLASADAFLVPMVFDPAMRRRMQTSFPSKLIEFAQFGKPIIVWGPEYCSAVGWAKYADHSKQVFYCTDPSANSLLDIISKIITTFHHLDNECVKLSEFCPIQIQHLFIDEINQSIV